MSSAMEMVANSLPPPTPPPAPPQRSNVAVRERQYAPASDTAVQDSAAVRARQVSMAAEEQSVQDQPPPQEYQEPDHVDVFV